MADEITPFDIHFSALKSQISMHYQHMVEANHLEFMDLMNSHFPELYDRESRVFWEFIDKFRGLGVFKSIGHAYAEKIEVFDKNRFGSLNFGDRFGDLYRLIETARGREYAEEWMYESLINSERGYVIDDLGVSKKPEDADWAPLPIERDDAKLLTAIEASEEAIKAIEQDNGYAATHPEERNAILAAAKGTIDALKEGTPSKEQVVSGLLKPFRYVARKFGESVVGALAKKAAEAIMLWIF